MTLSQRGLSVHINRSVSWIRKQGNTVFTQWVRENGAYVQRPEYWRRCCYADGRLSYYELAPHGWKPEPILK